MRMVILEWGLSRCFFFLSFIFFYVFVCACPSLFGIRSRHCLVLYAVSIFVIISVYLSLSSLTPCYVNYLLWHSMSLSYLTCCRICLTYPLSVLFCNMFFSIFSCLCIKSTYRVSVYIISCIVIIWHLGDVWWREEVLKDNTKENL